jgi:transcriptional regulator with XRE-family HTH domain
MRVRQNERFKMPTPASAILRDRLKRFGEHKGLTITGWCKLAGITEGTLRGFLNGRSQTLTHATLAALAAAAGEPIAALLAGRSAWGNTEEIEVTVKVDATERLDGSAHLPDDDKYRVRLPTYVENTDKFGAEISDDSANEFWPKRTILICVDFQWNQVCQVVDGDFLVTREERNVFDESRNTMQAYRRCTVRQVVRLDGSDYLMLRSKSPRFQESVRLPAPIIGVELGDPIVTGLGMTIVPLGKVLTSVRSEGPQI